MSRETTLTLRNLASELQEVVDWYRVGLSLGIKSYQLEEIRINRMGDAMHCKLNMLDLWLRGDVDASWSKLVGALAESNHSFIADRIREKYLGIKIKAGSTRGSMVVPDYAPVQPVNPHSTPHQPSRVAPDDASLSHEFLDTHQLIRSQQGGVDGEERLEKLLHSLTHSNFDVNFTSREQMNQTLLHYATQVGDIQSVKGLIAFGANVNCKNAFGQTPLDLAQMHFHREIIGLLESVGGESGLSTKLGGPGAPVWGEVVAKDSISVPPAPQIQPSCCRILSLDSSGVMAVIQLEALSQLERASDRRIAEMFDWIVASGVGALLVMAMVYANKTMTDLRRLYFKLRERVFLEKHMDPRSTELEAFIQEELGTTLKMSDVQQPKLLIGTANKQTTKLELRLFNNCLEDEYSEAPIWKVARYTCALPLYTAESDGYVDGGMICPNLSDHALAKVQEFYRERNQSIPVQCVVSVGAGVFAAEQLGCVDVQDYLTFGTHWRNPAEAVERLRNMITLSISAATALAEEVATNCRSRCDVQNIEFYRFNPILEERFSLLHLPELKLVVSAVIQTIVQVIGQQLETLVQSINNA